MVLAPEHPLVDQLTTAEQRAAVAEISRTGRREIRSRADRSGEGKNRRLHRRLRDQSGQRRTHPDLDRRLRADGLRHRRDHGRARRTTSAIWSSRANSICRSCRSFRRRAKRRRNRSASLDDGIAINSPLIDGLPTPEAKDENHRVAGGTGTRPRASSLQTARLAFLPPALLGRAVPDRLARRQTRSRCRNPNCRSCRRRSRISNRPAPASRRWRKRRIGFVIRRQATRETNTMPQWAGSCWYYLRFCDPQNDERFVGEEAERYWMGGDRQPGRRRSLRRRHRARRAASACTRASGTRCSSISAISRRRSRSSGS